MSSNERLRLIGIKLNNYRSYKHFPQNDKYLDISSLTVLIGKNDVGKSNLLRAIKIFLDGRRIQAEDFHRDQNECVLSAKFEVPSSLKPVFKKLNDHIEEHVEISISFSRDSARKSPTYSLNGKDINNRQYSDTIKPHLPNALWVEAFHDPQDELSTVNKETLLAQLLFPILEAKSEGRAQDKSISDLKKDLEYNIQSSLNSINEYLSNKIRDIWSEDIKKLSIQIESLDLKKASTFVVNIEDEYHKSSYQSRGSGLQRMLILTLLDVYRELKIGKGWVLLFEEPEIHLHASAQRRLFGILKNIAEQGQVIISTHSPIFINNLSNKNNHKLYLLTKKNGLTELKAEINREYIRNELGCKPSDVLYSNGIIVVEGPNDSKIIKSWCKKLFDEWEEYSITILHGGGSSVPQMVKALIPELHDNIVVIVDGDEEGNKYKQEIKNNFPYVCVLQWTLNNNEPVSIDAIIDRNTKSKRSKDDKKKLVETAQKMSKDNIPNEAKQLLSTAINKLLEYNR